MRTHIVAGVILVMLSGAVANGADLKAPAGCVPADDAKAGPNGSADRVIHEKTGIELLLIPAGAFLMGTKPNAREVTIPKPFYIGKTEITNARYRAFVEATGYEGKADTDPAYDLYLLHWNGKSLMSKDDAFPVVWVSWKNAKAFCQWAGLSLPTEAQWEYACRGGTTTKYYFGDSQHDFDDYGWGLTNSEALTHPVAQKKPNAWGLYDMHGNAWEWCEDDWGEYDDAPSDGSARVDEELATKSLRGGSWSNTTLSWVSGSAARFSSAPGNASNDVGFRVVVPIE